MGHGSPALGRNGGGLQAAPPPRRAVGRLPPRGLFPSRSIFLSLFQSLLPTEKTKTGVCRRASCSGPPSRSAWLVPRAARLAPACVCGSGSFFAALGWWPAGFWRGFLSSPSNLSLIFLSSGHCIIYISGGLALAVSFSLWGVLVVSSSSSVWSARRLSGSAVGSGASRWFVRASGRSLSGAVLVAGFVSFSAARSFALRWSGRLPARCRGCVVRRRPSGLFAVSVPVAGVGVSRG